MSFFILLLLLLRHFSTEAYGALDSFKPGLVDVGPTMPGCGAQWQVWQFMTALEGHDSVDFQEIQLGESGWILEIHWGNPIRFTDQIMDLLRTPVQICPSFRVLPVRFGSYLIWQPLGPRALRRKEGI